MTRSHYLPTRHGLQADDLFDGPSDSTCLLPVVQNPPHHRTTPRRSQISSSTNEVSPTLTASWKLLSCQNQNQPSPHHRRRSPAPLRAPAMHQQHASLRIRARSQTSETGPSHGYNISSVERRSLFTTTPAKPHCSGCIQL